MEDMQFSVLIKANRDDVWDVLWQDETFRDWAGLIDPGTYMRGELKEGNEVEFISDENGYGVRSLVVAMIKGEFLLLHHEADTQDAGLRQRENEWTGGQERYVLIEENGVTELTVTSSVPVEMEEFFMVNYPKALQRVKELAENKPLTVN